MFFGKIGAFPILMLRQPAIKIISIAGVVLAIGTF